MTYGSAEEVERLRSYHSFGQQIVKRSGLPPDIDDRVEAALAVRPPYEQAEDPSEAQALFDRTVLDNDRGDHRTILEMQRTYSLTVDIRSDRFRAAVKDVFERPGEWGPAQGYYSHYLDHFIDMLDAALRRVEK